MRNVVLIPALLLALSTANASAENLSKAEVGSTRWILEVYDKELVPEDRKHIETFINGMQIGLMHCSNQRRSFDHPVGNQLKITQQSIAPYWGMHC